MYRSFCGEYKIVIADRAENNDHIWKVIENRFDLIFSRITPLNESQIISPFQ